jgi:hypothetical protein
MDLEGMRKLTEPKMEGQAMLPLRALIRKTASRCLLFTWRGRKFNLSKRSSYLKALALLKESGVTALQIFFEFFQVWQNQ